MLIKHLTKPQTLEYTVNVMAYELGAIARGVVYADAQPEAAKAHLAEARLGLVDLLTMCRLLAEQMGLDYETLVTDGEERFIERMKEVEQWKAKS